MARKPRIEYAGAVYHVMSRGDNGARIFLDEKDYELFHERMESLCRRTGWLIHCYATLPNHFHWLIETPEANLVSGMKWFLGAYTQRFNARHGRRGHVFQGRYKALLVEPESRDYFERVSTYIHLNPVRAGLLPGNATDLAEYAWSSYPLYLGSCAKRPEWLRTDRVLGNLGFLDNADGRRKYGEYMRERIEQWRTRKGKKAFREEWKGIRFDWCVGSEEFREKMTERVGWVISGKQKESYAGDAIREHGEREAERLVSEGLSRMGLEETDLRELKKGDLSKQVLAWYVCCRTLVSQRWLSERLTMGCASNLGTYVAGIESSRTAEVRKLKKLLVQ